MNVCDISGRDPYELLYLLHSFACIRRSRGYVFCFRQAKEELAVNGYAGRICGMRIYVNVFRSPCNYSLYDELYGEGSFEAAIAL